MISNLVAMTPLICTNPDGTTYPLDNTFGGLPFISGLGQPDNCVDGPSMAEQATDAVFGPGSFRQAVAGFVRLMSTFWLQQDPPALVNSDYQASGTVAFLSDHVAFYTMVMMTLAIAIQGALIAWKQRAAGLEKLLAALGGYLLVVGPGAAVISILLQVGHSYAVWITNEAGSGGFADNLQRFLVAPDATNSLGIAGVYFLLGIAIIAAVVQYGIMLARLGALTIMVGTWPLAASVIVLDQGRAMFTTYSAFLLAVVLYEPAAATVYAGAFSMMGTPPANTDAGQLIAQGIVTMILAILTLPALIRILAPVTAPAATGNGIGGAALSTVSMAAMLRRG